MKREWRMERRGSSRQLMERRPAARTCCASAASSTTDCTLSGTLAVPEAPYASETIAMTLRLPAGIPRQTAEGEMEAGAITSVEVGSSA